MTGREHGASRRPHLTVNNKLMGTGRFASPPRDTPDYRRGYLCGMIRGDGHLGSYTYPRPGRVRSDVHRFRLALVDLEALRRSRAYLMDAGVATTEFVFQAASGERKRVSGIRASSLPAVTAARDIVVWPVSPSDDWARGFLAGLFDAEGSYSCRILRIANTDPAIIREICSCLRRFGFRFVVESTDRANGLKYVRLLGGLREHLRFFHGVDPVITRKRSIEGVAIKGTARLGIVSIERLGVDLPMFDITTSTGDFIADGVVSHNCFARKTHTYLDLDAGQDFNSRVVVKVNAAELLRKELAARSWRSEHIAMGTNVDCYQRAEGRYRLMRGILEALRDAANPFSILTKGSLILRDLDLLQQAAEVTDVGTNVSVGFVDRELWRSVEPGTPSPQKRLEVCRTLNDAGIRCGVLMAPILPFLTDSPSQLAAGVKAIAEAGATHVAPIVLHLRPGAREWFTAWLAENHPELVPRFERLYRRGSYAPKAYQEEVTGRVHDLAIRFGVGRAGPKDTRRISSGSAQRRPSNTAPRLEDAPEQIALL